MNSSEPPGRVYHPGGWFKCKAMTRDEIKKPEDEARFLAIPDWQAQILNERLADFERNPDDEQTWDEVNTEIRSSR